MKKAIISFIIILVGVYALLTFLDLKGDYPAERALWYINVDFAEAVKDPKIVPEARFDKIRGRYEQLIRDYPDSAMVPLAHILVGRVYLAQKDYERARQKMEEVIAKYRDSEPEIAVKALEDIGRTYAIENDPVALLDNYRRAWKEFPLTDSGLKAPVFIGQYHARRNEPGLAAKAFSDAIEYYRSVIERHPDTLTAFNAWRLIATCYFEQNEKEKGVRTLGKILNENAAKPYMTPQRADTIVKLINTTSILYLRDYDLPIDIYEEFMERHPGHPFSGPIKAMVDSLKLLREKGAEINV